MSRGHRNPARIRELDGIRGWAALVVLLFHVFWEGLGERFVALRSVFAAPFLNGDLAVCIFFVVSGAALSAPFHASMDRKLVVRSAIKRYPRLLVPIAAATLLVWLLSRFGLMHGPEAADILGRRDWLGLNNVATVSSANALYFTTSGVFSGLSAQRNILPFLWTMPIEMVGSMLLFLYLACKDVYGQKSRLLVAIIVMTFVASPYICCFFIGSLIVDRQSQGAGLRQLLLNRWIAAAALLLCLLYSGLAVVFRNELLRYPNAIVAAAIVFYCLNIGWLSRCLSASRLSSLLGKISFPLYLSHYAVLGAVFSPLVVAYQAQLTLPVAALIGLATVVIAILVAIAFSPVEQASHRISKWIGDYVLGEGDGASRRSSGAQPSLAPSAKIETRLPLQAAD